MRRTSPDVGLDSGDRPKRDDVSGLTGLERLDNLLGEVDQANHCESSEVRATRGGWRVAEREVSLSSRAEVGFGPTRWVREGGGSGARSKTGAGQGMGDGPLVLNMTADGRGIIRARQPELGRE